eukprot:299843-Chlamydomonas_euryale.AAC.1
MTPLHTCSYVACCRALQYSPSTSQPAKVPPPTTITTPAPPSALLHRDLAALHQHRRRVNSRAHRLAQRRPIHR